MNEDEEIANDDLDEEMEEAIAEGSRCQHCGAPIEIEPGEMPPGFPVSCPDCGGPEPDEAA